MTSNLALQRLANQRLPGARFAQPEEVVRWMGALQAQDYTQGVWAIGVRTQSATLAQVEQAIAAGQIVRTWPMRGTIHFIPARDAKWMLQLSAVRTLASARGRQAQLGLDEATLERSQQLFYDALQGGRRLTRPEMLALLQQAGISTAGQRGYHILVHASLAGLICLGPLHARQQTFVLLDEWVPDARQLPREEALAELAGRYFASHGPATLRDFTWWTGLTLRDARAGLAAAGQGLVVEKVDEQEYWRSPEATPPATDSPPDVHLLPGFDEYLLGYTDRSAVLAKDHAPRIIPGGNGVFRPLLVVDGQVCGTWRRSLKKNACEITLQPFEPLAVPPQLLAAAAQRYSDFLGLPLSSLAVEAGG